ncbi:MAG: hypothetical protein KHW59_08300 [Clostridiales bacterium]|nr:hypothetical protein [Clostridiales bacterium]
MRILVACEESQAVTIEMRRLGHEAYSCDIEPCSGGHPEWHIQGDAIKYINGDQAIFRTMDGVGHITPKRWDMIIAHPPCTYLTVAGNRYFNVERYGAKALERYSKREQALGFFMKFINADCDRIAVENPVGVISTRYRTPDQIIHPYQFGHPVSKKTCLWLKGLPLLSPTEEVDPELIHSRGKSGGYSGASWHVRDENGKIIPWNDPRTAKSRSKTFPGIAKAMAEQWAGQAL